MDVPRAIAVDSRGRIFVADLNAIQVFTAEGSYVDRFDIPTGGISGMAFTDHDALYVTSNTNEVHVFGINE
jgi:sugar lactone lactonase YvrE